MKHSACAMFKSWLDESYLSLLVISSSLIYLLLDDDVTNKKLVQMKYIQKLTNFLASKNLVHSVSAYVHSDTKWWIITLYRYIIIRFIVDNQHLSSFNDLIEVILKSRNRCKNVVDVNERRFNWGYCWCDDIFIRFHASLWVYFLRYFHFTTNPIILQHRWTHHML